ncbi:unnamed protein product [Polarella glacialis]|uniref:Uncharacterized protein n=1 Tax=Polarella glacialis TaxID=89957 RepID=A0A813DMQ4_POLGL|nr:unnamed protein product [Polarella glacialis]
MRLQCKTWWRHLHSSLLYQSDLQQQGVNTTKERAATVMIVVTAAIVVAVSDYCDSDCCNCFECYSLRAIVPVLSPVMPFAVSIVVIVTRVIMCIVDIGMNELTQITIGAQNIHGLRD